MDLYVITDPAIESIFHMPDIFKRDSIQPIKDVYCLFLYEYFFYQIFSYSSALHLLARLQRTRSLGRLPYEDLGSKSLMKTSFQRAFDPKSSQG